MRVIRPPVLIPPQLPTEEDRIFASDGQVPQLFRFDETVAKVFPDMLRRSIPGYATLLHLIGVHAARTLPNDARIYDLGCSLGAVSLSIRHALGPRDAHIVAVDNSEAMVTRCREIIEADSGHCTIDVVIGDILEFPLSPCHLVVMNFTLQFVPVAERVSVLSRIKNNLLPGGTVILSEKTAPEDPQEARFHQDTHDAFREGNGYTRLELSRKRDALEQVLAPVSPQTQIAEMQMAGLVPTEWFRCLNFVSWVARAEP